VADLTDEEIGGYYDRQLAYLVDDLPEDGRAHLRRRYIEGVRENPKAMSMLREILNGEER
jgi:hypothetical protein